MADGVREVQVFSVLEPVGEEVKRDYRKLYGDEIHALHFSPNILERSNREEEVGKACCIYGGE